MVFTWNWRPGLAFTRPSPRRSVVATVSSPGMETLSAAAAAVAITVGERKIAASFQFDRAEMKLLELDHDQTG